MANVLAKLPQQRIRAGANHPTLAKLEQLFDYMDDLGIDFYVERNRIRIVDRDRPKDKAWEIRDIVNSELVDTVPPHYDSYKLTQNTDVSPRNAQPAPANPIVKKKGKATKVVTKQKVLSTLVPPIDLFEINKFNRGKK